MAPLKRFLENRTGKSSGVKRPTRVYKRIRQKTPVLIKVIKPGYCRCGQPIEAAYVSQCENCFAEYAERWPGRDQSAVIY